MSDIPNAQAILYCRVSTEEQGASGLGLEAQRSRLLAECGARGWSHTVLEDVQSARNLERPALELALERLGRGEATVLMVAKLDRLTRSVVDLGNLMERAKREHWSIVALDLGVDMTTAGGEMVANIVGAIAQWERRTIGERTRDALAIKRSQGVRLGRPTTIPAAHDVLIHKLRMQGLTLRQICERMDEIVKPPHGKRWQTSTVARVLRRAEAAA